MKTNLTPLKYVALTFSVLTVSAMMLCASLAKPSVPVQSADGQETHGLVTVIKA
ncbi:MAG: hypothetical protein H7308_05160 [Chthonomonadaceae bacterium]|nr:hypothetical protein [Chthonomonadaceae bacterium]